MTHAPKDIAVSVRARLLRLAQKRREDFQLLLTRYANERLLYRLAASAHGSSFVLKGAALFTVWTGQPHRATRDLDLLGFGDGSEARIRQVFEDVVRQHVPDDGVVFEAASLRVGPIREDQAYGGVRVLLFARIVTARVRIQVDIGLGDAVTPAPERSELPALLNYPAPSMRTYPRETVIAEKTEAMVKQSLEHIIDSAGRDLFKSQIPPEWALRPTGADDYGIDAQLEVFEAHQAEKLRTAIQLKSTQPGTWSGDTLTYALNTRALATYVDREVLPVFLAIPVLDRRACYFVHLQRYVAKQLSQNEWRPQGAVTVEVPSKNVVGAGEPLLAPLRAARAWRDDDQSSIHGALRAEERRLSGIDPRFIAKVTVGAQGIVRSLNAVESVEFMLKSASHRKLNTNRFVSGSQRSFTQASSRHVSHHAAPARRFN